MCNASLRFALAAVAFVGAAAMGQAYADNSDFSDVLKLGGDTTLLVATPSAFSFKSPAQNLSAEDLQRHLNGDQVFETKFSNDPASTYRGLGPAYNHLSCVGCHISDGRGVYPPPSGDMWTSLGPTASVFLRISVEDAQGPVDPHSGEAWGGPHPVPGYGLQLFQGGVFGLRPDAPGLGQADVLLSFDSVPFTYPDGTTVQLRKPIFKIDKPYDTRLLQPDVHTSPRMTPAMIGLGLLEAVREEDILALAARDLSREGIHGHVNWVYDLRKDLAGDPRPISLGRFGLKSSTPTIFQQVMGALNGDMGVTTKALPLENIWGTSLFDAFKPHWSPGQDLDEEAANLLVLYSQTLAVPSRRGISDSAVRQGGLLFTQVGCANCHQPDFVTGPHEVASLSGQKIYPFTDLLLHDMGDGLADDRSDFQANGREWRTRPLWGLGVTQVVNARSGFLHDGRARNVEEAILWHDGEAAKSRAAFAALSLSERQALLQFLRSL